MALNQLLAVDMPRFTGLGVDPGSTTGSGTAALEKIVSQVLGVLTVIAVIYFAVQIILAGYAFISAEGDEKKVETARKSLTYGVLGLVIVVVAVGLGTLLATLAGIPNVLDLEAMFGKMQF